MSIIYMYIYIYDIQYIYINIIDCMYDRPIDSSNAWQSLEDDGNSSRRVRSRRRKLRAPGTGSRREPASNPRPHASGTELFGSPRTEKSSSHSKRVSFLLWAFEVRQPKLSSSNSPKKAKAFISGTKRRQAEMAQAAPPRPAGYFEKKGEVHELRQLLRGASADRDQQKKRDAIKKAGSARSLATCIK